MKLSPDQLATIDHWIWTQPPRTQKEYEHAYQNLSKGGRGWNVVRQGGTGVQTIKVWYNCRRTEKRNNEWRPQIIIKALLKELEIEF